MDLTPFKLDIDELLDEFCEVIWLLSVLYRGDWVGSIASTVFTRLNRTNLVSRFICLWRLKELVIDAKENGIGVVPAVVKRMLEKNMFLFGFVDTLGCSVTKRIDDIAKLQNKRVQIAFDRLFANSQIESYLNIDLGAEFELKTLKKISAEYERAKELAMKETSSAVEAEDVLHTNENKKTACDAVESIVEEWEAQNDDFYKQTGRQE